MRYIKCFMFYFLIVFFVNYLFPGIDVINQTKLPHIGGDLIFAVVLGLLNFVCLPLLRKLDGSTGIVRISLVILVLNFAAYAVLKLLPLGIFVTSLEGYLAAAFAVSVGSILLSYFQLRGCRKCEGHKHEEHPHSHTHM